MAIPRVRGHQTMVCHQRLLGLWALLGIVDGQYVRVRPLAILIW